ncbi:MAG: hypothetical protein LUD78_10955 [Clostridiales bacterium]|nr:hypothetical protein [Clostridiales bacterium]
MKKSEIYSEAILAIIAGQGAPARLEEEELLDTLDELFRRRLASLNSEAAMLDALKGGAV